MRPSARRSANEAAPVRPATAIDVGNAQIQGSTPAVSPSRTVRTWSAATFASTSDGAARPLERAAP